MPLNSINTNVGAMQALAVLSGVNAEMAVVQQRISTGLKVASPKDNPAIWAIAQQQRGEVRALDSVMSSLDRGRSAVDVAITAAETVSDLMIQMKELAVSASGYDVAHPGRLALDDQYQSLKRQIDIAVANADFDGINLLSAGGTGRVRALANTSATSTIDVDHADLSTTGALLTGIPANLLGGLTATSVSDIGAAMQGVNAAIGRFGTGAKALRTHRNFVAKQQDVLQTSIGNLVDADLAREAARFEALKVRQQLAIMALQIANQQPSLLLQLFQRR